MTGYQAKRQTKLNIWRVSLTSSGSMEIKCASKWYKIKKELKKHLILQSLVDNCCRQFHDTNPRQWTKPRLYQSSAVLTMLVPTWAKHRKFVFLPRLREQLAKKNLFTVSWPQIYCPFIGPERLTQIRPAEPIASEKIQKVETTNKNAYLNRNDFERGSHTFKTCRQNDQHCNDGYNLFYPMNNLNASSRQKPPNNSGCGTSVPLSLSRRCNIWASVIRQENWDGVKSEGCIWFPWQIAQTTTVSIFENS